MAISTAAFGYLTSSRNVTAGWLARRAVTIHRSILWASTFHPFVLLSGTFTRFTDDELLDRYSSRHQYVKRVRRAAEHLAAKGYITNADGKALITAAQHEPLPAR